MAAQAGNADATPVVDCRSGAALEAQAESVAIAKTKQANARCFALSVLAGMEIALGATLMLFVKSDATLGFAPSQLLGGISFSLGLLCVIVAGAELFTGNSLMVCAACSRKISWSALVKNWVVVYFGNMAGSLLMVALMTGANIAAMNSGAVGQTIVSVAAAKIGLDWGVIFFRGIPVQRAGVPCGVDGLRRPHRHRQGVHHHDSSHGIRGLWFRALHREHVLLAAGYCHAGDGRRRSGCCSCDGRPCRYALQHQRGHLGEHRRRRRVRGPVVLAFVRETIVGAGWRQLVSG